MAEVEDRDMQLARQHVAALAEHFDSVQIFCSRKNVDGSTVAMHWGAGNWYARYGHVRLWMLSEERSKFMLGKQESQEPQGSEEW